MYFSAFLSYLLDCFLSLHNVLLFVWIITDMDNKEMLLEPESDSEDDPAPGNEVTISHKSVRPGE